MVTAVGMTTEDCDLMEWRRESMASAAPWSTEVVLFLVVTTMPIEGLLSLPNSPDFLEGVPCESNEVEERSEDQLMEDWVELLLLGPTLSSSLSNVVCLNSLPAVAEPWRTEMGGGEEEGDRPRSPEACVLVGLFSLVAKMLVDDLDDDCLDSCLGGFSLDLALDLLV